MKKSIIFTLMMVVLVIFIAGCVDYKAYDIPEENPEDAALINEIAQIEAELGMQANKEESQAEKNNSNQEGTDETAAKEVLPEVVEVVLPEVVEVVLPELEETSNEVQIVQVNENEMLSLKPTIVDPDEDVVTFSFSKPLDAKGQWKTNYGDAGEYLVKLTASDGKLSTVQEIKIIVKRVNVPPVIGKLADIIVKEGEDVKLNPDVKDPNGDAVTLEISAPLKEGLWSTDHTSAGEYLITVKAGDGELSSETKFTLTVTNVNELPQISGLVDSLKINEGETVKIVPVVTDLDGDQVTVTISEPVGNDGVWETKFTDNGVYSITVVADDGKDKVTKKIALTVVDVNMPPQIVKVDLSTNK